MASELAAEDAIFTCDVGSPIVWAARYLKVNGKRRIIGSFNHGSMANAMLHAIGAQTAFPDRQVISLSGDGGFTMMMGDFITLTQKGLNVKIIVLNNGSLGFIEMEMKASGFPGYRMRPEKPEFRGNGRGDGRERYSRRKTARSAVGALTEAFAHHGPALVDVVSARQELAMPPKTTSMRPTFSACSP